MASTFEVPKNLTSLSTYSFGSAPERTCASALEPRLFGSRRTSASQNLKPKEAIGISLNPYSPTSTRLYSSIPLLLRYSDVESKAGYGCFIPCSGLIALSLYSALGLYDSNL